MLPTFAASAVSTAIFPPIVVPNWLGSLAKTISVIGQITFVVFFFIFPDGRFVPRWTFWLAAIWTIVFGLSVPLGFDPFEIFGELFILFVAGLLGFQIYRYRKFSGAVEKQQTKWVVIGLAISLGGFLVLVLLGGIFYNDQPPPLVDVIISIAISLLFALIPVWIGIAITRYRFGMWK